VPAFVKRYSIIQSPFLPHTQQIWNRGMKYHTAD